MPGLIFGNMVGHSSALLPFAQFCDCRGASLMTNKDQMPDQLGVLVDPILQYSVLEA